MTVRGQAAPTVQVVQPHTPTGAAGGSVDHGVWDLFHGGVAVIVLWLVVRDPQAGLAGRVGAALAVLAFAAAYLGVGRRLTRSGVDDTRGGLTYLAVLWLVLGTGCSLSAEAAWLLASFSVQAFFLLGLSTGVVAVSVATLTPPLADLLAPRHDTAAVVPGLWRAVVVTASAALGASWIDRLERRSSERAALVAQLQASRAEVAALSRAAGTTAERTRLSGEIHDTLAQGFLSILTLLQAADGTLTRRSAGAAPSGADVEAVLRYLRLAQDSARENLSEARSMVAALAPPALTGEGLVGAVRRRARRLTDEAGIASTVEVLGDPHVDRGVEVVLLRAVQELLTNVERHAGARAVSVTVDATTRPGEVALVVLDDGVGATTSSDDGPDRSVWAGGSPGGFGLRTMRDRVETVGGTLEIGAGPAGGTAVSVLVPATNEPTADPTAGPTVSTSRTDR